MNRILSVWAVLFVVAAVHAVPAYPGWQTKVQPDGSTITVRLIGDEFCSYWETEEGGLAVERPDGRFVRSTEPVPTPELFRARRAAACSRRNAPASNGAKKLGQTPNLAPRGVVILVNFSDAAMKEWHTRSLFDNLCNAQNCTVNTFNGTEYGSAAQYFADQSNGSYRPVFDVFGPVNLPHNVAYYGKEGNDANGNHHNDLYMADFVIDAVMAAEAAGCDFSLYDSDEDGLVDFVYFIYAGKGQAYGGSSETIWPHNWNLASALWYNQTHGSIYYYNSESYYLPELDGKIINNYACSAELDGYEELGGIGTLCHEFSHVMGLPDLYDIANGEIGSRGLTPGVWDIMAGGSYNGNMHCPPCYDPWEKYFFGWVTPVNPGSQGTCDTLRAPGSGYNTYQINFSDILCGAVQSGENYYIENRQQRGWDEYLPGHGLVVWRVNYDAEIWGANSPNGSGTVGAPRFVVESAGEPVWNPLPGKPVESLEKDGLVIFKYKDGGGVPFPEPEPRWSDWAYYDDGIQQTSIGYGGQTFYWGVMFPAYSLAGNKLTKVAVYETASANRQAITVKVYSGGYAPLEENIIFTQTVQPSGQNGFHEITLSKPVVFNRKKNLWIILSEGTEGYPAHTCADTGDPNGRWISGDGYGWIDLKDYNLNLTFMIRAYVKQGPEPDVERELKLIPGVWSVDGARMAAWVWGGGLSGEWAPFYGEGDTLTAMVKEKATDLLFFRYNPGVGLEWNAEWNRTPNLTIDWTSAVYAITGWGDYGIAEGRWVYPETVPSGLTGTAADLQTDKMLRNGQLFIRRGDKIYTLTGQQIK